MIKVEKLEVFNIEGALRGMRNPLNSWNKSDSYYDEKGNYIIGPNDLDLCQRLINSGSDHRKFMRQIGVCLDITAPLYWWKEFDTYKVGTTANSTSTMHKIHSKEFTKDDFSCEHMTKEGRVILAQTIEHLNIMRNKFNETKDKQYWYDTIQTLPSSYNQTRTVTLSFENLRNMYFARKSHKLAEWRIFCTIISEIKYGNLITYVKEEDMDNDK